jgi:hypothetical protein
MPIEPTMPTMLPLRTIATWKPSFVVIWSSRFWSSSNEPATRRVLLPKR